MSLRTQKLRTMSAAVRIIRCNFHTSFVSRSRSLNWYSQRKTQVNRRLACVRKNRGVLPQTACAHGPPWNAAELMFPFANVGMIAATNSALNQTLAAYATACVHPRYIQRDGRASPGADDYSTQEAITAQWPELASVADQGRFHALMRRRHIAAWNFAPGIRFAVDAHARAFLNLCCPRLELFDQGVPYLRQIHCFEL